MGGKSCNLSTFGKCHHSMSKSVAYPLCEKQFAFSFQSIMPTETFLGRVKATWKRSIFVDQETLTKKSCEETWRRKSRLDSMLLKKKICYLSQYFSYIPTCIYIKYIKVQFIYIVIYIYIYICLLNIYNYLTKRQTSNCYGYYGDQSGAWGK